MKNQKTRAKKGRTLLSPEQAAANDAKMIADFDAQFPIGKNVWYWTVLPFGPVRETQIREAAWILPSGQPVCMVKGVSGSVSIWHIQEVDESRRKDVEFVK